MKSSFLKIIILSMVIPYFTGCASLQYRAGESYISPGIYPGVRTDIDNIKSSHNPPAEAEFVYKSMAILSIFDLPFSFIMDTICLPYDIFQSLLKKGKEE